MPPKTKSQTGGQRTLEFASTKGRAVGKNALDAKPATVEQPVAFKATGATKLSGTEKETNKSRRTELDAEKKDYVEKLEELTANNISVPIHQQGISTAEKLLKQFDMTAEYGPTAGMSRLERWMRAERLGKNPPKEVKEILESKQGTTDPELSEGYLHHFI
jgi:DNA polymerase delta subunit 4